MLLEGSPRAIRRIYGQSNCAYIRPIDLHSFSDRAAAVILCNSLPCEFWYAENPRDFLTDVMNSYPKTQKEERGFLYAISDAEYKKPGSFLGFIGLFPIQIDEIDNLAKQHIIPPQNNSARVFEIMFAKLPNSPCGIVSNGLRQSLVSLSQQEAVYDNTYHPEKLEPNTIVLAHVLPDNEKSIKLLESVGFHYRGINTGERKHQYLAYVLGWKTLHESVQKRADGALLSQIKIP